MDLAVWCLVAGCSLVAGCGFGHVQLWTKGKLDLLVYWAVQLWTKEKKNV